MRTTLLILMFPMFLAAGMASASDTLESAIAASAYRNNTVLAAEANEHFARALELRKVPFTGASLREFLKALDRAALIGHPGAADLLCIQNSHEMLGTAFFRQGYFWCGLAVAHFSKADPNDRLADSKKALKYTIKRLGRRERYLGEEFQDVKLQMMKSVAAETTPAPAPSGN